MIDSFDGLRTRLLIEGGKRLQGVVAAPGAKNAALPIMAAAILAEGEVVLHRVPRITDVDVMAAILESLGAHVREQPGGTLVIDTSSVNSYSPSYALVSRLNASFDVTGALIGRFGRAEVPQPGGCVIGPRAVDLHLAGFEALGVEIALDHGAIIAIADDLVGTSIALAKPSVGATKNIMLAAIKAKGTTTIENAALEPEVVDLADFLNACGARVSGHGTRTIVVEGVRTLRGCEHTVIPDRIVAGTYLIAGAITSGDVTVQGLDPRMLHSLAVTLGNTGLRVSAHGVSVRVQGIPAWKPIDVVTEPYPAFPTDLQAPLVAYLSLAKGTSHVEETIFDARFVYVSELARMGADVKVSGRSATVTGVAALKAAPVEAPDIRAGGALVLAALAAEGKSEISGLEFIDRGYEFIEEKLNALGAAAARVSGVAPVLPRDDVSVTDTLPRVVTPFRAMTP